MEETIREFLTASILGKLSEFDFDSAFEEYQMYLLQKLTEHGQTSFDDYVDHADELYYAWEENLGMYAIVTDWVNVSVEDLRLAILKAQWDGLREAFWDDGVYKDLRSLYKRIGSRGSDIKKLTLLFDEAIHAQHHNGDIIDGVDIDEIKEELDRDYEMHHQYDRPQDVRTFRNPNGKKKLRRR